MNIRHFLAALLLLAFPLSDSAFAQTENSAKVARTEPLSVSASHSNAGPYGELWIAYLAPDGDLSVRASHRQSDGQTTSQYFPHKERVTELRRAVNEARFLGLRDEIAPATQHFHRPFVINWRRQASPAPRGVSDRSSRAVQDAIAGICEWTPIRDELLLALAEHEVMHEGQIIRHVYGLEGTLPKSWKWA